jgi:trehalose 6-phosphate synthase
LVAVSNRLPVSKTPSGWKASSGGLVTALRPIMEQREGAWVGWNGGAEDMPRRVAGMNTDLVPLSISRAEVQAYYHGFSNRTLWPLFHDLVQTPTFNRSWWRTYYEVNERFADTAAKVEVGEDPLFWVQDYQLMLLPAMLRERREGEAIAFFLHIPWPPPELFSRLPWRRQLLEGLLGADVVSFHTERYRKNFTRTAGRLLNDITVKGNRLLLKNGRVVRTHANPISIDAKGFAERALSAEVEKELSRLRDQFQGRHVLLGVDRLDYTKGILERLEGYEDLLERRADLRGKVTLVQIAVPSRSSVREYRELREQIEQATGRINGRFTEPGSDVPIIYLHRGVSLPRLMAYYRIADVMLVTPLKDGMNLVAKEFVVAQSAARSSGILVLSEFTGAAIELERALPCNPFDTEGLSMRMEEALDMNIDERRDRMGDMARRIHRNNVFTWVERELDEVELALAR